MNWYRFWDMIDEPENETHFLGLWFCIFKPKRLFARMLLAQLEREVFDS